MDAIDSDSHLVRTILILLFTLGLAALVFWALKRSDKI
jgi:cbb3-type cytochrome oxidase subunit 3